MKDLESYHNLKSTSGWKIGNRRKEIFRKGETFAHKNIVLYAYRPFDTRCTYYCEFLRRAHSELMKHFLGENMALALMRRPILEGTLSQVSVVDAITDKNFYAYQTYFFPLYLYTDKELIDEEASNSERTPNFTDKFLKAIKEALGTEPAPEEIFYYIYAVLYAPTYRKRYEEFLKIDFPRVPLPTDYELFKKLSELGKELVEFHLLKHPSLSETGVGFPVSGSNIVEKVRYDEENERVYFNKRQYFDGISKVVWEYRIGAYQVMAKYLKDRKNRELSLEEIEHYMWMAKAIERTIEVQRRIENVF